MKDRKISTGTRTQIESRLEDINILLSSCNPFAAMFGIKNLSSDLRSYVGIKISDTEYANYTNRLEKMIFDTEKTCKCSKRK